MGPPPLYGPWRTLYWAFTGEKKGGGIWRGTQTAISQKKWRQRNCQIIYEVMGKGTFFKIDTPQKKWAILPLRLQATLIAGGIYKEEEEEEEEEEVDIGDGRAKEPQTP